MDIGNGRGIPAEQRRKWRKVAYGGMQPGYDDNYTDDSFLEDMVMNANVVKRDMVKVMLDSVIISQYLSIVALVGFVWTYSLQSRLDQKTILLIDAGLLMSGFLILLLTEGMISVSFLIHYLLNLSFSASGLYLLAPVYKTLTRSIRSDSIWAVAGGLLIVHLILHDYSQCFGRAPGMWICISLNSSIMASIFVASRLPSQGDVFAMMLFSLVFLFAPLVAFCIKKYSFRLHIIFSVLLMCYSLALVYRLHTVLFVVLLGLMVFIMVVCPYWLIRIQEYKLEINGPWDEAKRCFDITD
ncbi:hypothetical protein MLD38_010495 [Melastoma candidum]|uniref:Uncharacterized protein n=1 Tax=Melastoma candidum TaxID=119954 RepID=A0ACB9QZH2_9MYRT|nr:hypothetical protein MLD38_010495 [Melastoma candidum]